MSDVGRTDALDRRASEAGHHSYGGAFTLLWASADIVSVRPDAPTQRMTEGALVRETARATLHGEKGRAVIKDCGSVCIADRRVNNHKPIIEWPTNTMFS